MLYSSSEFVLSFMFVFGAYLCLPNRTLRVWLLSLSSLFFLAWGGIIDTCLFLLVVIVSWASTRLARRFPKRKKLWTGVGITALTGHLFLWKYAGWLLQEVQSVFPDFLAGYSLKFPLPLGISFFTLQGIGYLVDSYRGQAEKLSLSNYLLFKSFFSQLVAGPIARGHQLIPQIKGLSAPSFLDLSMGVRLFVLGLVKKVVIADRLAPYVDAVFTQPQLYDRTTLCVWLLGYTLQIWADFSGYTDMGRGSARCLGIQLPENFLSPYLSRSPREFWHRWHITLSQWIRDYIYIPLCNRVFPNQKWGVFLVLLITFGISGLWHGASWNFLIWGLFHGFLLIGYRFLSHRTWVKQCTPLVRNIGGWGITFSLVMLGWLIFRCDTLTQLGAYLGGLALNTGDTELYSSSLALSLLLAAGIQIAGYQDPKGQQLFWRTWLQRWTDFRSPRLSYAFASVLGGVVGLATLGTLFLRNTDSALPFIYFRF